MAAGFVPPPYPYDRLDGVRAVASEMVGGAVDLSVGTPCDPPASEVLIAFADPDAARRYPPSIGSAEYRRAVAGWLHRRFGVVVDADDQVAACIGTKEFVASTPQLLRLRRPERDTVLYPEVSYPTYAMGAALAGCRAVPVPVDDSWRMDLSQVHPSDAERAVCLWANTPSNPTGALDDLAAVAAWGREHEVIVLSDECYAEFTWTGSPRSVLQAGPTGVLAVHSLSKRSNLAGVRAGFYAGDAELVDYLREVRKHAGAMVPGPVQAAGAVAWSDDAHVAVQRERYRARLAGLIEALGATGLDVEHPDGAFYLWVRAPDGDGWGLAARLAEELGIVVSPGEFYGPSGAGHVRVAAVLTDDQLAVVLARAGR